MADSNFSGHAFRVEVRTLASNPVTAGNFTITREWSPIAIPLDQKLLISPMYRHSLLINDAHLASLVIRPEAAIAIANSVMAEFAIMLTPELYEGIQVRIGRYSVTVVYEVSDKVEYSPPISGFQAANSIPFSSEPEPAVKK